MPISADQAKTIFLGALEISKDQRPAFLEAECGDNDALRREVERLLTHHGDVGSFLESPPLGIESVPTIDHSAAETPGNRIGPYKLRERIGAGGMGEVWAAEQKQPLRRKVALKVIKPGMDSEAVIARFEAEREALALMDHPNIARVLDAGTTEQGRPYFVMELIRGMPITEYCDQGKFTVRQRLDLFIQVCNAVQHAHQKGIIHRDIKPSNLLVTEQDGSPLPKVIDFGVAKALHQPLTERSIYTGIQQAIGTLAYMSPEQAALSARDVDTRADVYGMGVLLYELLTGATPFDRKQLEEAALDEACRVIREQNPPKPSTKISTLGPRATAISVGRGTDPSALGKMIRGDLDWIAMKALEKDRSRRYETVAAFALDVRHYLDDEPIQARPPSTFYRCAKFAKKHRAPLAAASLLLMLLLVSLASISWLAQDLKKQRDLARAETERANTLATELAVERDKATAVLQDLAESLFDQGLTDILSGNVEAAREKITGLQQVDAKDRAEQLQAQVLIESGDYTSALEILLPAVEREPESIAYRALLTQAYGGVDDWIKLVESENVLQSLPRPTCHEDVLLAALVFEVSRRDYSDQLELQSEAFTNSPSPLLLACLGSTRGRLARETGQVKLADQALRQVHAAKELVGLSSPTIRTNCLWTALNVSNLRRSLGQDGEQVLREVEDVVRGIEEAKSPAPWERLSLGHYYYARDESSKALNVYRQLARMGDDVATWVYLGLAAERGMELHADVREKLDDETAGTLTRSGAAYYYLSQEKPQQAWNACSEPKNLWEHATRVNLLLTSDRERARDEAEKCLRLYDRADLDNGSTLIRMQLRALTEDWSDEQVLDEAHNIVGSKNASAKAYFGLAFKYYDRDKEKAVSCFRKCIEHAGPSAGILMFSKAFVKKLEETEGRDAQASHTEGDLSFPRKEN